MSQRASRWRTGLRRTLWALAAVVAVGVALPFGCVGNRMFNTEPEDYLRNYSTSGGLAYSVAVVEFDDQGQPWDLRQLDAAIAEIRRLNRVSDDGIILYQFIHGWKSNAARERSSGERLAWFEKRVAAVAEQSELASRGGIGTPRPVVGLYIGWRGRTYSLPILIDASFWNRRVAAHRVASKSLQEVLYRSVNAAREHPDAKCALLGHSMGGMILEETLGPALVSEILLAEHTEAAVPVRYDLIVSANASTSALHTKQLIDVFNRTHARLVLEDSAGRRRPAGGPMIASITSVDDGVTRYMVPLAMTLNSLFVRYRPAEEGSLASQRRLGIRTAGHLPALHSHTVDMGGGDIAVREIPGRWNDTPFWVFQVPAEISRNHGDIDGPLWGRLMLRLLEGNRVFDPSVRMLLTVGDLEGDSAPSG
ncbi:MAG: hypothetical protein MUC56_06690 [Thermoanaerobaculales bacterium]|jgi:hypothetical protein|nr:hypothetical protein [Thermoanaerobaculales bacterium]